MAKTRHRSLRTANLAMVSQSTREDAKPANKVRFGSFQEEWDFLVEQKTEIQRELSMWNRRASKDNIAIRANARSAQEGFKRWQEAKGHIESNQHRLREDLHAVEDRMSVIKPKLKSEKERKWKSGGNPDAPSNNELLVQILDVLKEINAKLTGNHTQ